MDKVKPRESMSGIEDEKYVIEKTSKGWMEKERENGRCQEKEKDRKAGKKGCRERNIKERKEVGLQNEISG